MKSLHPIAWDQTRLSDVTSTPTFDSIPLNYTIDDGLILTTSLFPAFLQVDLHVSETIVSIFSLTTTIRFLHWTPDVSF